MKESELNLDLIPPVLRAMALEAFDEGDPHSFLCLAPNDYGLEIVRDNAARLFERGIYEAALLHAYTQCRMNHLHFPLARLKRLFEAADRDKLGAAGDPLPPGERFTLYRGVAGRERRVRSFSWTLDLAAACWFAARF
jgi:hypothetical protein